MKKELSEYFLGTETKKFYNGQIANIGEFSYGGERRSGIRCLKFFKNLAVWGGRYLPNITTLLSIGAAAYNKISGNDDSLCDSAMCIVGSEAYRNVMRVVNDAFKIIASKKAEKSKQNFQIENGIIPRDMTGYDGWLYKKRNNQNFLDSSR